MTVNGGEQARMSGARFYAATRRANTRKQNRPAPSTRVSRTPVRQCSRSSSLHLEEVDRVPRWYHLVEGKVEHRDRPSRTKWSFLELSAPPIVIHPRRLPPRTTYESHHGSSFSCLRFARIPPRALSATRPIQIERLLLKTLGGS